MENRVYRICKAFAIESGHMLSKHPERCRYLHGHSRRIELVLASPTLDENDMVCDFKWIQLAVQDFLDRYDHALCVNVDDPNREALQAHSDRVIVFEEGDPTTELMAKNIFDHLSECIRSGLSYATKTNVTYTIGPDVRLERVRVTETPTSWAEYAGPPHEQSS